MSSKIKVVYNIYHIKTGQKMNKEPLTSLELIVWSNKFKDLAEYEVKQEVLNGQNKGDMAESSFDRTRLL